MRTPPNSIAGTDGFFLQGKTRKLLSTGHFYDEKSLLSQDDGPPEFGVAGEAECRRRRRSGRELYEGANRNYQAPCRIPVPISGSGMKKRRKTGLFPDAFAEKKGAPAPASKKFKGMFSPSGGKERHSGAADKLFSPKIVIEADPRFFHIVRRLSA
ncbi:MAG TPA: hypothetical protein PKY19_08590 [Oscillospiraceae bacterium]|nr:hypothetical protein [Oscillospiraceae bacterium]